MSCEQKQNNHLKHKNNRLTHTNELYLSERNQHVNHIAVLFKNKEHLKSIYILFVFIAVTHKDYFGHLK